MAIDKLSHPKNNVIKFPYRMPLNYCPETQDHTHEILPRPSDPDIKRCIRCGMWFIPEDHPLAGVVDVSGVLEEL